MFPESHVSFRTGHRTSRRPGAELPQRSGEHPPQGAIRLSNRSRPRSTNTSRAALITAAAMRNLNRHRPEQPQHQTGETLAHTMMFRENDTKLRSGHTGHPCTSCPNRRFGNVTLSRSARLNARPSQKLRQRVLAESSEGGNGDLKRPALNPSEASRSIVGVRRISGRRLEHGFATGREAHSTRPRETFRIAPSLTGGCSSMVERQLPRRVTRVARQASLHSVNCG